MEPVDFGFEDEVIESLDIQAALDKLSPQHREVVQLILIDDWSHADVANYLGLSRSRVTQLNKEAKCRLKEMLRISQQMR